MEDQACFACSCIYVYFWICLARNTAAHVLKHTPVVGFVAQV